MTKFQNVRKRASAAVVGAGSALAAGAAAASGGGGFDSSSITTKIAENGATAVLIVGAFILAVWGIRSMGLLKKG